jgi:hypothetical protein
MNKGQLAILNQYQFMPHNTNNNRPQLINDLNPSCLAEDHLCHHLYNEWEKVLGTTKHHGTFHL